jgi:hypothetical protein
MNSRRSFFKIAAGVIGLAVIAPKVFANEGRRSKPAAGGAGGGEDLPLVEPGKDMAASVGYAHKSPHKDKNCANCVLYTKHGMKGKDEVGKCNLFAGKVVYANGYCNSWAKKV